MARATTNASLLDRVENTLKDLEKDWSDLQKRAEKRRKDFERRTNRELKRLRTEFVLPERIKTIPTRTAERTYFSETVRDYLLNKTDILGDTYQERYNQLFRGGLRIHTTLNASLQQVAEVQTAISISGRVGFEIRNDSSI